ncbi:hypothetical protein SKAU_G00075900 [Synaphobranchus kaupii]|uniref:Gypsy retrotransposon integrase-like protein 1 n=1 Tax=Synaphobranchus kaupii TaxID=118154 RepID=A0A9Q1JC62_SYNKA|nr:hypothetical protein SKAU_G00075900 [Synaphobranchus kaupii]
MKSLARSFVWWPGMDCALEEKVKACTQCQSNQKMPAPAPLHPWPWPGRPWSRLHLDFAGPFMGHMFLVLVDSHSKWLEARIMSNITAPVTTEMLRSIFATHGLPDTVVTDNGPTFTSDVFQEFMDKNGIRHVRTAPYHPASNGLAERAVGTLKEVLRNMSGHSLETKMHRFLFQYRITPHTTTGVSPAEMLMGRRPKSHLDLLHPDVGARVVRSQEEQKEGRQVRRHQDHLRVRHDVGGKEPPRFSHKDSVGSSGDCVVVPGAPEHMDELSVPLEGLSMQTEGLSARAAPPAPPAPNLTGRAQPAPGSVVTTAELRRSKRQHKPPDRLNC